MQREDSFSNTHLHLPHHLTFMHFEYRINTLFDATHAFPPVLCLTYERGGKMQQRQQNSDRESGSERGSQSVGMQEGGGIWFPWQHAEGWALGVRSISNCVALHRPSARSPILPHSLQLSLHPSPPPRSPHPPFCNVWKTRHHAQPGITQPCCQQSTAAFDVDNGSSFFSRSSATTRDHTHAAVPTSCPRLAR